MPDTPEPDPSTLDRRFEVVVEEFLREREAGRNPDPQRYLDSFPELAAPLRDFFAGQDLFDRLAPDLAPEVRATPAATRLALPQPGEPGGGGGGFELLEELGRGGMGVVYRARQPKLGRVVALKMIRRGQADAAELARFRVEAEAIARLQHPNIVQVFEVGERDGMPFVALEYCPGGSLAERLRGTALPPAPRPRAPPRPRRSSRRWPGPCRRPTSTASSTATSSPPTCCWPGATPPRRWAG